MLVLNLKAGKCLTIGDNVEVKVVSIHGNKVLIGITAPKEITVRREDAKRVIEECPGDFSEQDGSAKLNLRRAV